MPAHPRRAGARYHAMLALATLCTFVLHEAAHWAAGTALGYPMLMGFNGSRPASPGLDSLDHALLIAAAGPAMTLLQGIVAFVLVRRRNWLLAYPWVFAAWFMRTVAALASFTQPNDEARIGMLLGLYAWPLPTIVVLALLALTWIAATQLQLRVRDHLASVLVAAGVTIGILLMDGGAL